MDRRLKRKGWINAAKKPVMNEDCGARSTRRGACIR